MPCRCRMRLAAPLSVFLALALSLSPVFSCYAYAEGSPEGQEVADEAAIDGGADRQPDEGLAQAEPAEHSEVGEGSEEEKAAQPVLPEVPSGAGYGSGGSAGSGVDVSSEDAYSSGWRWAEPSVSGDLEGAYQGAYFSDLASPSQGGIMLLAGFGGSLTGGFGGAFSGGSGLGKSANTTDVVDSFTAAWGWGYNSSVAHLYANSPAGWLKSIKDNTGSIVSKLGSVSSGQDSLLSLLKKQWGYGYGGTVVIESNSPIAKLKYIQESSLPNINDSIRSVTGLLQKQWGYGYGGTVVIESNSPIAKLSNISANLSSFLPAINNGIDDLGSRLNSIFNSLSTYLSPIFNNVVDISARTGSVRDSLSNYLAPVFNNVVDISSRVCTVRDLLDKYIAPIFNNIVDVSARVNLARQQLEIVNKGLSDILAKLDYLKVDVSVSNSDLSLIEGKLDSILDVLRLGLARDVIDTLLGDLDFSRLASLSADVEGAISSAFPFCIPAVMKQVLGLLEYDGSAPVWEFDIAGSPLVCDFRGFQPVADVSGWVARIGFVLVLLANTRRFVFMGGGAVAE